MGISNKDYALKILMANVHVKNKEKFKNGLEEVFYPEGEGGPIEADKIIHEILGSAPEDLNTLEEIANAIDNDNKFSSSIYEELSKKITEEELNIWIEENFPVLTQNEILEICK